MRKSEIFDSFVKIAQEKGLVSEGTDESVQKKIEKTKRIDSLSIEDIAKLYDVKPDSPVEMHYIRNIVEVAHPKPFVSSPSYDKLQGLVENLNENQDITLNILNQVPTGRVTQRKYAEKELLLSLVRTGNDLDNRNQDKLRSLADHCLTQLSDKMMKKEGQIALLAIAAGIIGAIYAKNHLPFVSDGFAADHEKLMSEIDDLLGSSDSWGVGYTYKPQFIQMLTQFKAQLTKYAAMEKQVVEPLLNQLSAVKSPKEAIALAKHPAGKQINDALFKFRQATDAILFYIQQVEKNFSNPLYKQQQTAEKGFFSSLLDSTQVLHGGKGLIADDFDDVTHALETYKTDIQNIYKVLGTSSSVEESALNDLRAAAATSQQLLGPEPTAQPVPSGEPASPEGPIASDVDELEKQLAGEGFGE